MVHVLVPEPLISLKRATGKSWAQLWRLGAECTFFEDDVLSLIEHMKGFPSKSVHFHLSGTVKKKGRTHLQILCSAVLLLGGKDERTFSTAEVAGQ